MPRTTRSTTKRQPKQILTKKRSNSLSKDSDFDPKMGVLFHVEMAPMSSRVTRQQVDKHVIRSRTTTKPNSSIICIDDSDDEIFPIDGADTRNINENIKGKVDTFFKFGGLISDDEEMPSFAPVRSNLNEPCSTTEQSSVNSVDVLENKDDSTQISSMVTEFCKETAHILENANALLDKLTKSENKSSSLVEENALNVGPTDQGKRLRECPVCYENLSEKSIMSTKCGHLFCKECIEKVATRLKTCPICKKPVTKKNIIPIYI